MTKIRNKILPFILPVVFFLLPWQTRWIFAQNTIGGESFEYGVISLYVVEALVVLAFIIYGRLKICQKYQKAVGFSFLILGITFISMLWAINGDVAFGQFVHILIAMMLFLLLLDSRTNLRWVSIGLIAGLMIPIGLGIWQVVIGSSIASTWLGLASRDAQILGDAVLTLENDTRILRAYGSFSHPNIFGGYLVAGLLSLLILPIFSSPHHHPSRATEGSRGISRILWYTAAALLLIGLILTYSQSAWIAIIIGLICGIGILFYYRHPERSRGISRLKVAAGVFSILIILGSIFGVLILNSVGVDQSSISERAEQYQEWPDVASNSIVLGSGLGNYTYSIEQLDQTREWWQYQPVHNTPMLIIGEIGILGLILVIGWLASIDKLNFNRLPKRAPLIALMMGCALLVIAGLDHYLWTQWSGLALVVYVMALTARIE